MIHRSMPLAELSAGPDGAGDVALGEWNRLGERPPEGETGSDRGGERAPGAVRMTAGDALVSELGEFSASSQQVDDVGRAEVAALDHDGRRAERQNTPCRLATIFIRRDAEAGQRLGFRNVR